MRGEGRTRPIDKALAAFNASLPRRGRVMTQCRRCLVAHQVATTTEIREWCYVGTERQHWHFTNIRRALRQLGAKQIGRATGMGRPGIWVWKPKA
jgi:hypothetical protein